MKRIVKLYDGDTVPENAKYLSSGTEPDKNNVRHEWRNSHGIMGIIPIFGTETLYRITPQRRVHYYEIEGDNK